MKAKLSKKNLDQPQTARHQTAMADVSHPTLAGFTERVERVVDTLARLHKQKYIPERSYLAAERYKAAHEVIYSSMGGSMDFERIGGSSNGSGRTPALTYMIAAELLRLTKKSLLPGEYTVMHLICAEGWSIDSCARKIYHIPSNEKVPRVKRRITSERLKCALKQMADAWFGKMQEEGKIRSCQTKDARPNMIIEHDIMPEATAVHATQRRIFRKQVAA